MKRNLSKLILTILVIPFLMGAWWGDTKKMDIGDTILVRDSVKASDAAGANTTSDSVNLDGYNHVRIDVDVGGTISTAVYNLQCSNDTAWFSGDSVSVSTDTWADNELIGCRGGYYVWIESLTGTGAEMTVYCTPYNR